MKFSATVRKVLFGLAVTCLPATNHAQSYSFSNYGEPGLIDMPSAQPASDAEFALTVTQFAGAMRTTLMFQAFPRLSGSFRYGRMDDYFGEDNPLWDRSFDLRYQLLDEGEILPAVAIGLRDIVGTGIYSSEYLVATKHLSPGISVTAGIGWGRLGSFNGFSNPLGGISDKFLTRPTRDYGVGGELEAAQWFRGDAAFFGGIAWAVTDRLTFKAEYSSDAYAHETGRLDLFEHRSPFNFGVTYKAHERVILHAYAMHGSEFGFGVTLPASPLRPGDNGGVETAPTPVAVRRPATIGDLSWTKTPTATLAAKETVRTQLEKQGLEMEALRVESTRATLHIRNFRYVARAEAIGRAARILSSVLPASVETFVIVPVHQGMPLAAVTLKRSDLERFEYKIDGAEQIYRRTEISDAAFSLDPIDRDPNLYPRFRWSIGPYFLGSIFDPDNPLRFDVGAALNVQYDIAPGLVLSGTLRQKAFGNVDQADIDSPSALPRVRSDAFQYGKATTALSDLTLTYNFRPAQNVYGRLTFGYLEMMYAGISSELLWKRVDSPFALGVELNYVKQREFDQGLGFRDYEVATGHVSAYYEFANGYRGQLDMGRYLAGDWGGTMTFARTFANGWEIGAYATFTDVPFDQFGEGSFDKGIIVSIPLGYASREPRGETRRAVLQPILRDGGARLSVQDRLYDVVESYHDLNNTWGEFWR